MRNKSNLADPAPACEEPLSGPGSSVCFCRVMNRRTMAQEARLASQRRVGGNVPQDVMQVNVPPMVHRLGRPVARAMWSG